MSSGGLPEVRTEYINTDLLLESEADVSALVAYFNTANCFDLYVSEDRRSAGFESNITADEATPAQTISALLDAIQLLEGDLLERWRACTVRELDIGFNCGTQPYAMNHKLPADLLKRVAEAGLTLVITHYGLRPDMVTS